MGCGQRDGEHQILTQRGTSVRSISCCDQPVNSINCCPQSALFFACENGLHEVAEYVLMNGLEDKSQSKALISAVRNGHAKCVNVLLKHGADIGLHCTNEEEMVALSKLAFKHCLLGPATGLLHRHSTPAVQETYPLAMYYSVRNNWLGIVTELLRRGVDVNIMTEASTPLFAACEQGSVDAVRLLLQYGANPNLETSESHPLLKACEIRRHDIAKLLLEHGADVQARDKQTKTALHHALKSLSAADSNPELSMVNLLLDYGADTNTPTSAGETPLCIACSKGLTATVQRMLKCGAKVNGSKYNKSVLNIACQMKHKALVKLLLNVGADPNVPEETLHKTSFSLHIAAADNNTELIILLLNHGANVNVDDLSGNTALHHFIMYVFFRPSDVLSESQSTASLVGLRILLQKGADINVKNIEGETPLYLAVKQGLLYIVHEMLSQGADPNVHDGKNIPLCAACYKFDVGLVETLLKTGADPNVTDYSDGTVTMLSKLPLFIAVQKGDQELAEMLLNGGAKATLRSPLANMSAQQFALEKLEPCPSHQRQAVLGRSLMAKLLLEHSDDVNQPIPGRCSPLSRLLDYTRCVTLSQGRWIVKKVIHEAIKIAISSGANLFDSRSNLGYYFQPRRLDILKRLCAWRCTDEVVVEMFKAGAGFKLLWYLYRRKSVIRSVYQAKSIRLSQALVMAGCRPSADELARFQQSVSDDESMIPQYVELLSWLNEDRQQAPSLLRQCRVAIRRQLSTASCHRTILPAVDQLPLPSPLQQYLKFEGCHSEVNIEVESRVPVGRETTNTSDVDEDEQSDDDFITDDDYDDVDDDDDNDNHHHFSSESDWDDDDIDDDLIDLPTFA